jgi:adenylate kinase family enzyme
MRVLITGASGVGTTTLGEALASSIDGVFFDADDFYWLPTKPPFVEKRNRDLRTSLFTDALRSHPRVVVAGSIMGWGRDLEDAFDLVVFLQLETAIRIARLRERELRTYGRVDPAFLEWAARYDVGPPSGRSLRKHETWLAARKCPVVRIDGDLTVADRLARIEPHIAR